MRAGGRNAQVLIKGEEEQLKRKRDAQGHDNNHADEGRLGSVIGLETRGIYVGPCLIIDEALHAVRAETIAIEQNDGDDSRSLRGLVHRLEVPCKLRRDEVEAAAGRALLEESAGKEMFIRECAAQMTREVVVNHFLKLGTDVRGG
jgi:hypothetical protein